MPPDNGDETIPVKSHLTTAQVDFLDNLCQAGRALSRADAVRYIITRAMEKQIIDLVVER
ncbi:MAG: hypothetical protein WCQ59_09610 [Candidatus Cloacimonadaceae bacterium]|jgi:Arc/MetJ-type ribon-helix-helix transcriptional regulator